MLKIQPSTFSRSFLAIALVEKNQSRFDKCSFCMPACRMNMRQMFILHASMQNEHLSRLGSKPTNIARLLLVFSLSSSYSCCASRVWAAQVPMHADCNQPAPSAPLRCALPGCLLAGVGGSLVPSTGEK